MGALAELNAEMHDGDPSVRADWPWRWWGLEPLDRTRSDWQMRYASAFRVGGESSGAIRNRAAEPSLQAR